MEKDIGKTTNEKYKHIITMTSEEPPPLETMRDRYGAPDPELDEE
jgi:hypothetical protein